MTPFSARAFARSRCDRLTRPVPRWFAVDSDPNRGIFRVLRVLPISGRQLSQLETIASHRGTQPVSPANLMPDLIVSSALMQISLSAPSTRRKAENAVVEPKSGECRSRRVSPIAAHAGGLPVFPRMRKTFSSASTFYMLGHTDLTGSADGKRRGTPVPDRLSPTDAAAKRKMRPLQSEFRSRRRKK